MPYTVKEIYYTIQGGGAHAGRPAVFCRFTGCNLWSGLESDREKAACRFCDTDFVGTDGPRGGRYETADELAASIFHAHPRHGGIYVVFTGGEPLLQLDEDLVDACHRQRMEVAVETNGTMSVPSRVDWITVSPKAGTEIRQDCGDELKLVYPQEGTKPSMYDRMRFGQFFVQPMDGPNLEANTRAAIDFCLKNPRWRVSLQTHKLVGMP